MKTFNEFIKEEPSQYTPSQYDMDVIDAFFEGRPNVVGDEIMTVSSEDGDFTKEDIRIDLVNGRARKGMALYSKGILSLANPGEMIDKTPPQTYYTNLIRNIAKDRDIRVIG